MKRCESFRFVEEFGALQRGGGNDGEADAQAPRVDRIAQQEVAQRVQAGEAAHDGAAVGQVHAQPPTKQRRRGRNSGGQWRGISGHPPAKR